MSVWEHVASVFRADEGRHCKDCEYFSLDLFEDGDRTSWCERFPPVYVGRPNDDDDILSMNGWAHPYVAILGTCGEWRKRSRG